MATLEGLVASLQGPLIMENLKKAQEGQDEKKPKVLSVEDLIGKMIATPIPIGTSFAQGYAPGGPQLNFTGGSPFPVDDTPAALHNGALVLKGLTDLLGEFRKKKAASEAAAAAAKPTGGSNA